MSQGQHVGARTRSLAGRLARSLTARAGYDLVRRDTHEVLPRGAYDIVPRNYYSPVPDLTQIGDERWERKSELSGVDLHLDRAVDLLETELAPFLAEFDQPLRGPRGPGEFYVFNEAYESIDAELLYAMVRAKKPKRVLELGSGYTTLLISDACRRNAGDGVATEHIAFDPYPRPHVIGEEPPATTRFEPVSATDIPLAMFGELGSGDILFVDTTHTVKLGSDVNYIVLDILPVLAPGVYVHFHDIFLPWEYPRHWLEQMQYFWSEQYLIQAFLAFNEEFEVLLPAQALAREHPDLVRRHIPSAADGPSPAAFWLRRREQSR